MFDSDFKLGRAILIHLMFAAVAQDSSSLLKALPSALMNPNPPSLFLLRQRGEPGNEAIKTCMGKLLEL